VADDPDVTPILREMSRLNNVIEKVLVSDTLGAGGTGPWRDSTRVVRRAAANKRVAELNRQASKDVLVFGSRTFWNGLLASGLVD
jgi:hypothetical protein